MDSSQKIKLGSDWQVVNLKYKILKFVGSGTFGQVMKAQNRETREIVAVKYITNVFDHPYGFKKIMREIQILKEFSKMKNNIFTTGLKEVLIPNKPDFDAIFLVMDYKSNDLKKLFVQPKGAEFSLTEQDHLKIILYNLLCSVNFLHSANVAHRDLKPANILIDSECNITICDFGIARTIEAKVPSVKHSRSKTVHVASRWYRAPELIVGQNDYTTKVDIWSVGCIVAEVLNYTDHYRVDGQKLPLMRGGSCFPLSPCTAFKEASKEKQQASVIIEKDDQMIKILETVGLQTNKDLEFLGNQGQRDYIKQLQGQVKSLSLFQKFSRSDIELVKLITRMLSFNPNDRLSAKEALENKIFDEIRVPNLENDAPYKIYLGCDQSEQEIDLSITEMRNILKSEVNP